MTVAALELISITAPGSNCCRAAQIITQIRGHEHKPAAVTTSPWIPLNFCIDFNFLLLTFKACAKIHEWPLLCHQSRRQKSTDWWGKSSLGVHVSHWCFTAVLKRRCDESLAGFYRWRRCISVCLSVCPLNRINPCRKTVWMWWMDRDVGASGKKNGA